MKKKVIIIISVVVLIALAIAGAYAVDMHRMKNFKPVVFSTWGYDYAPAIVEQQDDKIKELYQFNDTLIGDSSKIRELVDKTNFAGYPVDSVELKTDAVPYGLTVNFMVDNRKDYRHIDENSLNWMSGLIFSLVKNADEIRYKFCDAYSDKNNKDDVFYGAYYSRQNLCERIGSSKITTDYIASSTADYRIFEEFYNTLLATEVAVRKSEFSDAVNAFIGEDYEVVVNSGIGVDVKIDDLSWDEHKMFGMYFSDEIKKHTGAGITAHFVIYEIRNFKTDEYKKCAFMYYTHPENGCVMIGEKILNESEYEEIKAFIIKESSKDK